jgi:GNAT superfamily N-acetyltransferase
MPEKLMDFSPTVVIPAIEESLREYWGSYGRAPGSVLEDSQGLLRVFTGIPFSFLNGVSSYQLSPDLTNEAIAETIHFFQSRHAVWEWMVGPHPSPQSLPESLIKHGFEVGGGSPGMAARLDAIDPELPMPGQLEIIPVEDAATLRTWAVTVLDGFELPDLYPGFVNLECSLGCQADYRRCLAILRGQPVATAALYLGKHVAGIYCVATLPSARKLGIGAAVTLRLLQEAHSEGYHIAVLQASQMGRSVYQRLGFQEFSTLYGYSLET